MFRNLSSDFRAMKHCFVIPDAVEDPGDGAAAPRVVGVRHDERPHVGAHARRVLDRRLLHLDLGVLGHVVLEEVLLDERLKVARKS